MQWNEHFFFVSFCCDVRFFSEVNRSQTLNVRSECNANVKNSSAVKSLGDSLMRIFFLNAILSFLLENYNPWSRVFMNMCTWEFTGGFQGVLWERVRHSQCLWVFLRLLSGRTGFIVKRRVVNRLQDFLRQPCLQFTRLEVSVAPLGGLDTLPLLWEAVGSIRLGAERYRIPKRCFLRLSLSGDWYAGGDVDPDERWEVRGCGGSARDCK